MENSDIAKLAAALSEGTITQAYITKVYGSVVLASVLALGAGYVAERVVGGVFDAVDDFFSF